MPSICMCPRIVFVVQVLDEICPLIAIATFGCAGVAQRGVGGSEHLLGNEGNLQASELQSWYTYINPNFNFQILQYLGLLLTRSNYQWPLLWSDSTLTKALSILTRRGRGDLDWEVAKCTKHQPSLPQPPRLHYLSSLAINKLNSTLNKLNSTLNKINSSLNKLNSTLNQAFLNPPRLHHYLSFNSQLSCN